MSEVTAQRMRELFRRLTTGVAVIATVGEPNPAGMTVNSLTPVSLEPPLLLFCAANKSATGQKIVDAGRFSVNILTALQEQVSSHHAGRLHPAPSWTWRIEAGTPWLEESNANFLCRVEEVRPAGDHKIIIGRIESMFGLSAAATPLLYHGGKYAKLAYEEEKIAEPQRIDDLWWTG